MAEIYCGVASETEATSAPCEPSSRAARRRRMEIRRVKFVAGVVPPATENRQHKRQKLDIYGAWDNGIENCACSDKVAEAEEEEETQQMKVKNGRRLNTKEASILSHQFLSPSPSLNSESQPKYGVASVCGRRRDMEDAVAVHPSFHRQNHENATDLHYFGVYDGHGCSHVATRCRERLHELVREELEKDDNEVTEWSGALERSFRRMDKEVSAWNEEVVNANCRCELQTPECEAVGSTAVTAIVTPDKIVVANCGDSRAVLCRNGKPFPLSSDHKPDRPDELNRIQEAGGRVIYWDGARVLGVLAMSRAIGDNYLKPYVCCEPEVTVSERTAEDECLIVATDGLWDVISNETACGVARMCLGRGETEKACSDASMLLTKLALARHSTDNVSVVVVDLRR